MQFFVIKQFNLVTNFEVSKYAHQEPVTDALFLKRIKDYIWEHRKNKILDADDLVHTLRSKYSMYQRRKIIALKGLAGRAICQLQSYDFNGDYDSVSVAYDGDSTVYETQNGDRYASDDETVIEVDRTPPPSYAGQRSRYASDIGEVDNVSDVASTIAYSETVKQLLNSLYIMGKQINGELNAAAAELPPNKNLPPVRNRSETPSTVIPSKRRKLPEERAYRQEIHEYSKREVHPVKKNDNRENKLKHKPAIAQPPPTPPAPITTLSEITENSANLIPTVNFSNVAGCNSVLQNIMQFIVHIHHPEVFAYLGIEIPRGFLLHGPAGCGKTLIAHAVAGELKIPLLDIAAPELVTGISGQSEERIRNVFDKALSIAPCVLFIDEVDAVCSNRENSNRDMERRIVSQLLLSLDYLNKVPAGSQVLVIGATSRPEALDPALRRAGRFDNEVLIGIPDEDSRHEMLNLLCARLRTDDCICFKQLAHLTPGFVGADLLALVREATLNAVRRIIVQLGIIAKNTNDTIDLCNEDTVERKPSVKVIHQLLSTKPCEHGEFVYALKQEDYPRDPFELDRNTMLEVLQWIRNKNRIDKCYLEQLSVTKNDFEVALKKVQPASKREGFATVPNVTWDDIGSLKEIRRDLQSSLVEPLRHQKFFADVGINPGCGVLLYGPPGCGKTLLAKAMANEAGINFISVKGPELLTMYFGGSEKAVRDCFQRARNSQPCIIFFDELDALCPKRSDSDVSGSTSRIVNQMLTEMDGIEGRGGVLLMAATNRIDIIDPAVLRPGRFDKVLYVGFPNIEDRADILRTITKKAKRYIDPEVDLDAIAKDSLCEGFTGADMAALFREATTGAVNEVLSSEKNQRGGSASNGSIAPTIQAKHFKKALYKVRPSVSKQERIEYNRMKHMCCNTSRKGESHSRQEHHKRLKSKRKDSEINGGKDNRIEGTDGKDVISEPSEQTTTTQLIDPDVETIIDDDDNNKSATAIAIVPFADSKAAIETADLLFLTNDDSYGEELAREANRHQTEINQQQQLNSLQNKMNEHLFREPYIIPKDELNSFLQCIVDNKLSNLTDRLIAINRSSIQPTINKSGTSSLTTKDNVDSTVTVNTTNNDNVANTVTPSTATLNTTTKSIQGFTTSTATTTTVTTTTSTTNNNNNNSNDSDAPGKTDNNSKTVKYFHRFNVKNDSIVNGHFGPPGNTTNNNKNNANDSIFKGGQFGSTGNITNNNQNNSNNINGQSKSSAVVASKMQQQAMTTTTSSSNATEMNGIQTPRRWENISPALGITANNNKPQKDDVWRAPTKVVTLSDIKKDLKSENENDNGGGTVTIVPQQERKPKPKMAVLKLSSIPPKTSSSARMNCGNFDAIPGSSKDLPDMMYKIH